MYHSNDRHPNYIGIPTIINHLQHICHNIIKKNEKIQEKYMGDMNLTHERITQILKQGTLFLSSKNSSTANDGTKSH